MVFLPYHFRKQNNQDDKRNTLDRDRARALVSVARELEVLEQELGHGADGLGRCVLPVSMEYAADRAHWEPLTVLSTTNRLQFRRPVRHRIGGEGRIRCFGLSCR